ncbi:uncharacterized protein LOC120290514 [Eucalyptus grandis]|uniref:uncharacterized protein LOC120290514 n=1 Tax=Eucalyptus grandis TaxID=71139 RepID=UPI00192E9A66|nr:uncharacterized protein LOC120290514 [Eucalyptus grandis]
MFRTRSQFVDEVLNGQDEWCLDNFWMDKNVFYKLCQVLQSRGLLRHTNGIKIEEQLAIFLFIIGHNLRTQAVRELFRYSGETISRHFNNVLNAITVISLDFFQPPRSDVPQEVLENPRLYPYFKTQVKLVVAGCAIHNYIHREKPDDWLFRRFEHGDVMQMDDALPSVEVEQPMFFENQDLDFPFVTEDLEMSLQLRDLLGI